ncbi:MAG: rRNA pseudouridine synthase, partial [Clostridia bacterium]|nr:rRNA pseudouridine synthase [Clostridia bacterium]
VTIRPDITDEQVAQMMAGILIDGKKTLPADVRVLQKYEDRTVLEVTLCEGRNRQIRKMCEALGLEVARLKRTAIGPVKLGMLQQGKWRDLTPQEVASLKRASK